MKKVLVVCLTVVLALAMSVTSFAAVGGFVDSPSKNDAPVIVEGDNTEVISYGDRDELTEDERKDIEDAYQEIINTENITSLTDDLKHVANDKGVNGSNLAVSDLFNVKTDENGKTVVLKPDSLENFVSLLRYVDGVWTVVDDAKVVDGNLQFLAKGSAQYAIVVDASSTKPQTPATGDNTNVWFYAVAMVASAAVIAVLLVKSKKEQEA